MPDAASWIPRVRPFLGAAAWAIVLGAALTLGGASPEMKRAVARVTQRVLSPACVTYDALFPAGAPVAAGQLVRVERGRELFMAGRVEAVIDEPGGRRARIGIFPEYVGSLREDARVATVSSTGDVAWVLSTLLPEEKLARVRSILAAAWNEEKGHLWRELEPGLARLVGDAAALLRDDLPRLVEARREDFRVLGVVARERGWNEQLREVVQSDLWPLVEARSTPLLKKIGDEIVERAPVWSLSWSYVLERLPFADDDALKRRMRRFIQEQVVPVLDEHRDEFKDAAIALMREALQHERVLGALQSSLASVVTDPRFRDAAKSILAHWTQENPRVLALLKEAPQRPDLRDPLASFFASREDDVRRIAHLLLLDDAEAGINPDLARVLRRRLLGDQREWILLELGKGAPLAGSTLNAALGGMK
jgi:hypothetical protein